jgi:hypothetical protein
MNITEAMYSIVPECKLVFAVKQGKGKKNSKRFRIHCLHNNDKTFGGKQMNQ